jgi:ABC-2 type transport system permease protein
MMSAVLALDLRIRRTSTLLWVFASALLVLMYMAIYPTVRSAPGIDDFVENLPEAFREAFAAGDYSTPVGYLQAEVFSGLIPVLLLVLAIGRGAMLIAGEEEIGRLGVLLTLPITRGRVYVTKLLGLALVLALVVFVGVALTIVALGPPFGVDIAIADVLAACVQLYLFALLAATLALAGGAATGRRGGGIALASVVFALGFFIDTLGRSVDWLERLRPLSPWRWYNGNLPLANGVGGKEVLVLVVATAVVGLVGAWAFTRRDLH